MPVFVTFLLPTSEGLTLVSWRHHSSPVRLLNSKCNCYFLPTVHFPSHFSRFLFLSNALTNTIHRAVTCCREVVVAGRGGGLLPYPVAPKWACTVTKSDSLIEQPTILPSICRQLTGGIFVVVVAERGGWGGGGYRLDAGFVCSTNLTINVFTQRG